MRYYRLICLADQAVLAPLPGYQGLTYRPASTCTQISVISPILLCTAVTPVRYRQPSDGVLYVLLPLVVIPVLTVATTDVIFTNIAGDLIVSISGAYLLLAALPRVPWRSLKLISQLSPWQPWAIAVSLSIATYALMLATFSSQFRLLSFGDAASVGDRAEFPRLAFR